MHLPFSFACAVFLIATTSVQAATLFQQDSFVSTTEGWGGGASPTHVATGGPAGAGDGYFEVSRPEAAPFHIAAKNTAQWSGNYTAVGISAITMDVNHFSGPDPITLRLLVIGDGGTWASTAITPISAGWNNYAFGLTPADLVFVSLHNTASPTTLDGSGVLADTLASVTVLQFRHDGVIPTAPRFHPPHIVGVLGVDNITAIPEPSSLGLLALATLTALCKRRRS